MATSLWAQHASHGCLSIVTNCESIPHFLRILFTTWTLWIRTLCLSFSTAKELRGHAELLPSGPRWCAMEVSTMHPTKQPVYLYWRDPLECIAWLLNHPLSRDVLEFVPHCVYRMSEKLCRVYTEWMTGDEAWNMQVCFPHNQQQCFTLTSV